MTKNCAFSFIGNIAIAVYGENDPRDDETHAGIVAFTSRDVARLRALVITDGGAPSAAQRKSFNDALKGRNYPSAVVSNAVITRGIVTALSWFNPKIRAFHPDATADALKYLDITPPEYPRIWAEVKRLEAELGVRLKSISPAFLARTPLPSRAERR